MPSSVGSDLFIVTALLTIILAVLLILRHYLPLRSTPIYLTVPVFLALAIPLSIFLLVPVDLASSSRTSDRASQGIWLPNRLILVAWRLMYWLTFALTWFILPLLGEYVDSGYRKPKDRAFYSLRANGRYQLIILLCAAAAAIYVFLINGFEGASVKSLVMALAYCWGLIMAIYLMGHGLVTLPRKLLQNAKPATRLQNIYRQAPRIKDRLDDACSELEALEAQLLQLRRRKNAVSRDHEDWIEELSERSHRSRQPNLPAVPSPALPAVLTDRYLAEFSRKLIRARHMRSRFVDTWRRLVVEAEKTKAIVDSTRSGRLEAYTENGSFGGLRIYSPLTPYTRHLLHARVLPVLSIIGGMVLAIGSACIIWSEFIKNLAPKLSIVSLTVLSYRHDEPQIAFDGQVVASMWLLYMSVATLSSFEDVKIWGNRALVKRNTYGESAAWYSAQIAKLTVPLTYNFSTFLPAKVHQATQYFKFLGTLINLTPLGKYFDFFFPMFILVPVCITLFHLYARVQRIFGFGILENDEDSEGLEGGWREGQTLIDDDLNTRSAGPLAHHIDGASSPPSASSDSGTSPWAGIARDDTAPSESRPGIGRQSTVSRRQAQRLADATAAAEEEDEGFFQGFAHRVKNTIDSVERPDWMNELGKRPKWMAPPSGEASNNSTPGRGLSRWFGGRSEGEIRL